MPKTIGDKINEILELRGMNRAELIRLTNISSGLMSDICNNKRTSVMVDTLKKIATALKVHPAYFLEDDTIGPKEILAHLPEEERTFVLDNESLPWLRLNVEAKGKGVSIDKMRQFVKLMSE